MTRPNIGDRVLISDGTYGSKYGIFVGPTIGLGVRGKVLLDFDQKIHRLSYSKMIVLPEATIVNPSVDQNLPFPNPSPVPSPSLSSPPSPTFQERDFRQQASPSSMVAPSPSEPSLNQSENTTKEELEEKLEQALQKLDDVTKQLASLKLVFNDLKAIVLSDRMSPD